MAAIIAPAIAGWLIGHALGSVYIVMLVVGCGAVVWVALRLEPRLPAGVNGVPAEAGVDEDLLSEQSAR